jgi:formamidopyrimidine-DNA glycosylase
MPELPEVETTKNSLQPLIGQQVTRVNVIQPRLRWPVPDTLSQLQGMTLTTLERRAKYILAHFVTEDATAEPRILLLHLGMSGSLTLTPAERTLRKHDHVIIGFESQQLRYHDPRRFGAMLWLDDDSRSLLAKLAPEPLSPEFNAEYLAAKIGHKNIAIKNAIMDNHIVVGVGNIYATEALFHCAIHPLRPAKSLTLAEVVALTAKIKRILAQAIALGGSTLRDYVNGRGENGYFQQTLDVYGRAKLPCNQCQTVIESVKIGQRASAYCPKCQVLSTPD